MLVGTKSWESKAWGHRALYLVWSEEFVGAIHCLTVSQLDMALCHPVTVSLVAKSLLQMT